MSFSQSPPTLYVTLLWVLQEVLLKTNFSWETSGVSGKSSDTFGCIMMHIQEKVDPHFSKTACPKCLWCCWERGGCMSVLSWSLFLCCFRVRASEKDMQSLHVYGFKNRVWVGTPRSECMSSHVAISLCIGFRSPAQMNQTRSWLLKHHF